MLSLGLVGIAAIFAVVGSAFSTPRSSLAIPRSIFDPRDTSTINGTFPAGLIPLLSLNASISYNISSAPRWSMYDAPKPGAIVNIMCEQDVVATVNFCLENEIPFLAQNGGHGWAAKHWDLNTNGITINMKGMNNTYFNGNRTQARIEGGSTIGEMIEVAYANDAQLVSGNCNCVGAMGANLGGGYGNLMGIYGFAVDNFVSIRVVLANGTLVEVTEADDDLWFALRGAAPNFGIVTSAVMKTAPVSKAGNQAWNGGLYYTEDKLEQVIQAIEDIYLAAHMDVFLFFQTSGPPLFTPTIMVAPFYLGTEAEGRAAFKSFLDIGPYNDTTALLEYNHWNDVSQGFCTKGGRKPSYGVGHLHMVPQTWRAVWNLFVEFSALPDAGYGVVLTECYSLEYAQQVPKTSTAFANRDIRFNSVPIPWYYNESLDATAEAYGSAARDLLRSTSGLDGINRTYVNFAYGDETNDVVYDLATPRLQSIKAEYDPKNIFNHWFPIQPPANGTTS